MPAGTLPGSITLHDRNGHLNLPSANRSTANALPFIPSVPLPPQQPDQGIDWDAIKKRLGDPLGDDTRTRQDREREAQQQEALRRRAKKEAEELQKELERTKDLPDMPEPEIGDDTGLGKQLQQEQEKMQAIAQRLQQWWNEYIKALEQRRPVPPMPPMLSSSSATATKDTDTAPDQGTVLNGGKPNVKKARRPAGPVNDPRSVPGISDRRINAKNVPITKPVDVPPARVPTETPTPPQPQSGQAAVPQMPLPDHSNVPPPEQTAVTSPAGDTVPLPEQSSLTPPQTDATPSSPREIPQAPNFTGGPRETSPVQQPEPRIGDNLPRAPQGTPSSTPIVHGTPSARPTVEATPSEPHSPQGLPSIDPQVQGVPSGSNQLPLAAPPGGNSTPQAAGLPAPLQSIVQRLLDGAKARFPRLFGSPESSRAPIPEQPHPGKIAANGWQLTRESLIHSLRQESDPLAQAAAKAFSKNKIPLRLVPDEIPGHPKSSGIYDSGTRAVVISQARGARRTDAMETAVHELEHYRQHSREGDQFRFPGTLHLGHEVDAWRAGSRVNPLATTRNLDSTRLHEVLGRSPAYAHLPPDPRWPDQYPLENTQKTERYADHARWSDTFKTRLRNITEDAMATARKLHDEGALTKDAYDEAVGRLNNLPAGFLRTRELLDNDEIPRSLYDAMLETFLRHPEIFWL